MDVCFIIDTSISVSPSEWDDLRRFIQAAVETLDVGADATRVGFVSYSHIAVLAAGLDKLVTL